jgi:AcrR family transcriptional regulator
MISAVNERSDIDRIRDARRAKLPAVTLDATARRILEAALRMFAMHGFHATSMRDLAKVLEIQPSALYASFPSKGHLLAELVRIGHEFHLASLRTGLLASDGDPVEQLRAVVRANAIMHATYPHLAVVVNDELHALPAELAAAGLSLRGQSVALLTDIVERGVAMKRFSVPDTTVTVAAIGAMSLRIPYWFRAGAMSVDALADAQAELALRIVAAKRD